jgi:pyruvate decarboxylase/indolepyruvate decarboxylase
MNMGKSVIDESHKQFIGGYNGDFSAPGVQAAVEQSDCLISFGSLLCDFNTGGFTTHLNTNVTIEIHSAYAQVHQSRYIDVMFAESIPALTKQLASYRYQGQIKNPAKTQLAFEDRAIKHDRLWPLVSAIVEKDAIVIGETGTSLFGALSMCLPDGVTFIGQTLWASIGYSVGSLLGACVAAPKRQKISTIIRHKLTPTIFLIDNAGYTVERVIHGPKMSYNDIQPWDYEALPAVFGSNTWSTTVSTEMELAQALKERKANAGKMAFITLKMDKLDAPLSLMKISENIAARNRYTSH